MLCGGGSHSEEAGSLPGLAPSARVTLWDSVRRQAAADPGGALTMLTSADVPADRLPRTGRRVAHACGAAPITLALEAALLGRRMAAAWFDEPPTQVCGSAALRLPPRSRPPKP
jgi:hypothetical protein